MEPLHAPPTLADVYTSRTWPYGWIISEGETLESIAAVIYGDPCIAPVIQRANDLSDPGLALPGMLLLLP